MNDSDSQMPSFNLIEQPWLLVRRTDRSVDELSLLDVVRQAHQLSGLLGEVPTQVFALTRLLLAVLHQATAGPRDDDHWEELWAAPELPADDVAAYLERHHERFDLLHPQTPFFQVAGLHTSKDEMSTLSKVIADVPNGNPFFTTRLGSGNSSLSFAEAARWLVHCQAFDPSGIKSGAVGDPRVKGGKGYPIGVAWGGLLGGVLAEGTTLKETLLLNLVARDYPAFTQWTGTDAAAWEMDPVGAGEEIVGGRPARGSVDLYTWQSRRVRISWTDGGVNGILVCNGERLSPQNKHTIEPHTAWRRSHTQEKKLREPLVYMPREHDPSRAVWRGLQAMLPGTSARHSDEGQAALAPIALEWIAHLEAQDLLSQEFPLRLRALGMTYGSNNSIIEDIVDDAMSLRTVLMSQEASSLARCAVLAAESADACARALGSLAAHLAEASGGEHDGPRARAQELAYAELDVPFRVWLAALGPDSNPTEEQVRWHRNARQITRRLGTELVEQSPPAAWSGRSVNGRLVTSAHADLWFGRDLAKAVPLAFDDQKPPPESHHETEEREVRV